MRIIKSKPYIKYCYDVLSGKINASKYIKLACQRTLDWFDRDDMYMDYDDVDKKINFIYKLKHSTGKFNGKNFALLPWQQWIVANIFGWKWKSNGTRVTRKALLFMSRKSGKTAFAAALSIMHTLVDNESSAEVEIVANSRQQAQIALRHCRDFTRSVDPKNHVFKSFKSVINVPCTNSVIQVLSSDAMGNDGYNSSMFIMDEFHAQRDWELYNVMVSSQGMRTQPLGIIITTAGFLLAGYPLYELRQTCCEVLSGLKTDDAQFAALYELDESDNWQDENNWIKASPSLGETVTYDYMREQVLAATNNTSLEVGVKTKNLNMFCQSKDIWIPDEYILEAMNKVSISDFIDEIGYIGTDLSSVEDLTAWAVLFPPNPDREVYPDKYVFKTFIYVPQEAYDTSINAPQYKEWCKDKYVKVTSGNVVDYDYILADQLDMMNAICLQNVYYDKYNATQWAINATNEGLPLEPFSQTLGNFNGPTKNLEILLRKGQVVIDYNPAVRWSFSNVELKFDYHDNCKPVKAGNVKSKKIDPVIAMVQAFGGYMSCSDYAGGVISLS